MENIIVEKINEKANILTKAYEGDVGYDLYCYEDLIIHPGDIVRIKTGIKVQLPKGTFGIIADRSSLGTNGLKVMGGIIDNGYRGEIIVVLLNTSRVTIYIKKNEKIAQLLVLDFKHYPIKEGKVNNNTQRGAKGFGSSNKKN